MLRMLALFEAGYIHPAPRSHLWRCIAVKIRIAYDLATSIPPASHRAGH